MRRRPYEEAYCAKVLGDDLDVGDLDITRRQIAAVLKLRDAPMDVDVERGPALQALSRLDDGTAYLRLADGTEWVCSTALFSHDMHEGGPGDNRFLQRLYALMVEHRALMPGHYGPGLEVMLLRRDSLDYRRVWCLRCEAWRDLQADAEEVDRMGSPWPEDDEEIPYEEDIEVDEEEMP